MLKCYILQILSFYLILLAQKYFHMYHKYFLDSGTFHMDIKHQRLAPTQKPCLQLLLRRERVELNLLSVMHMQNLC